MAEGLERRSAPETNAARSLRASAVVDAVQLPRGAGPASTPRAARPQLVDTVSASVAKGLGEYAAGVLANAVDKRQQTSLIEGQMAAQQGKTFEEIQMGGDKWALEGYRVVDAQRMASSLLTAQRAEIAQGGFEMNPEEYRAHFMNRVEGVLDGVTDTRTAELAREQLLKQIPVLVDDHMVNHLEWKEQRNFDSVAASVDTISMDPTAGDTLLAFADGGEGSPTAGLSEDRRNQAVAVGLVRAFENDNPAAYQVLAGNGRIKGLPVPLRRQIESAKRAFEQRNRTRLNKDLLAGKAELMARIEQGSIEPGAAVEALTDLYAAHDITATQADAGQVYSAAAAGIREGRVTTGMLVEEAMVRGDRGTAVDLIIDSLQGTESGGNAQAWRRNLDGREFGGALQFGAARLGEYNAATGESITVGQFTMMTKAEQRRVSRWHVKDVLDTIESKGLDKFIGSTINGVTVTRSGLVAVAHLGGKGGMVKFVSTNGKYNPADELGTTLTDYLRKHGTGQMNQFMSAAQRQKAIGDRITRVRELAGIDAYTQSQPVVNELDDAYRDGDMSRADWLSKRREAFSSVGVQRTMAHAKQEVDLMGELRESAENQLDEANAFAAGTKIMAATAEFEKAVSGFETGDVSAQDVLTAQRTLQEQRLEIQREHGLAFNADEELAAVEAQVTQLDDAVDARVKYTEEQTEIDAAVMSGTLDQLSPKLQARAVKAATERAMENAQDAVAADTNVDPEEAMQRELMDFYVQSNVVDKGMRRTLNGFLAEGAVQRDGSVNPRYVAAAEQYRELAARNPDFADKWIDKEHRNDLDAIMHMADKGPLEAAARAVGLRKSEFKNLQTTTEFLANPDVAARVDEAVDTYLRTEQVGMAQAIFNRNADVQQMWNHSMFDRFGITDEANMAAVRERVNTELSRTHAVSPHLRASELVSSSARRVEAHTPILGGVAVHLPMDGPSAAEMFFGGRAADFSDQAGAMNDALMDFFRTDEFREQYPFANDTTLQEGLPVWLPSSLNLGIVDIPIRGEAGTPSDQMQTLTTGVRPFQTQYINNQLHVIFSLPSGGYSDAITLDPASIGRRYIKQHNANAAGK
ncbi:endolysin [Phage MedPE-SWcel-C56]|uniref:Uncharacterized protein n=1 Tax=Phage MedPE-SWcel-C56 TaxID=1871314 RepID=A0A1B1IY41_9CAUD|nr:endolysin [Phage MedPE-SWcel-C56]ANS06236.1 hypothetical protein [Phage MedPE-SWcel-C56]